MMKKLLRPALGLTAAILLVGCAAVPFGPQPPQTPAQLAEGAFNSWGTAAAFRFKGSTQLPNEGTLRFALTESADGRRGQATGTLDGKPFMYLASSGKQYLQGQSFWQEYSRNGQQNEPDHTLAKGFEDRYVRVGGDVGSGNVVPGLDSHNGVIWSLWQASRLAGAVTDLKAHANALQKGNGSRTIDGRRATPLTFGVNTPAGSFTETFWVAQGNPDQLVGYSGRARDFSLQPFNMAIAVTEAPHPRPPAARETVDYPSDPTTIPAFYAVEGYPTTGGWMDVRPSFTACDPNSCRLEAGIQNQGGAPQGQSKAQISVQPANDGTTGSATCTADIPTMAPNQDATVSCTVSGAAWSSVVNAATSIPFIGPVRLTNNLEVYAKVADNPPYTGSS